MAVLPGHPPPGLESFHRSAVRLFLFLMRFCVLWGGRLLRFIKSSGYPSPFGSTSLAFMQPLIYPAQNNTWPVVIFTTSRPFPTDPWKQLCARKYAPHPGCGNSFLKIQAGRSAAKPHACRDETLFYLSSWRKIALKKYISNAKGRFIPYSHDSLEFYKFVKLSFLLSWTRFVWKLIFFISPMQR